MGLLRPCEDPDGGSLAGSIGAEVAEDFSRIYLEADPLECRSLPVFFTKFSTAMAGSAMAITAFLEESGFPDEGAAVSQQGCQRRSRANPARYRIFALTLCREA